MVLCAISIVLVVCKILTCFEQFLKELQKQCILYQYKNIEITIMNHAPDF